jgi:hypothetical protein
VDLFKKLIRTKNRAVPSRTSSARARRHIVLGIDYGTSSTKVAYRELTTKDKRPNLIDFGTRAPGFCRFAIPSAVALRGRTIVCGEDAETHGDKVWRAAKIAMLSGGVEERLGIANKLPFGSEAQFASAVTMATALLRASDPIGDTDHETKWIINVDIPVVNVHDDAARERFLGALRAAVYMWRNVKIPGPSKRLIEAFNAARDGEWERGVHADLVPEAHALMQGVRLHLSLEERQIHAIVDVGGGTTDIGIFMPFESDDMDQSPFWGSGSASVGCTEIDRGLATRLRLCRGDPTPTVLRMLSAAKDDFVRTGAARILPPGRVRPARLTRTILKEVCFPVTEAIRPHFAGVFSEAYSKQPQQDYWRQLRVFVVGGGSLLEPVRSAVLQRIQRASWMELLPRSANGPDLACDVVGDSTEPPTDAEFPFVLPALGLSFAEPELPRFVPPEEVPPGTVSATGATGLYDVDHDDLYSK